ncbi:hypothetical protein RhiirB3_441530 [Rhizophagus irregularis]|nr:hypothetical protein RhiirB3_441530 [Rhizophagus irregularis]
MHTPTNFDQTDHSETAHYDDAETDEYLSDSNSYTDNRSDLGSDNYNDYESNYESDNEGAPCASTSTIKTPLDLLNAIQEIFLSPPRDMSDKKGSSLYNAYDRDEVKDKLVIKIDQDGDRAPKFSVADDISEKDMETTGVKAQEVFIRICLSFIRALYQILDCSWESILNGLVIATSSDSSKCSYHVLYALALLIDHHELKAFTELVYTLTGEKFSKYIDKGLPGQNFNLHLISSAKKGCVKRILQFSLDNEVQPPTSLELKVRPQMLSTEKNNNPLRISMGQDVLQKFVNLVLRKYSNYLRNWTIEEKDSENFVYFNRKAPLRCLLCKRIHNKNQQWFSRVCARSGEFIIKCFWQNSDECGVIFECDLSIAEKNQQENKKSLQFFHKIKVLGFSKAFVNFPFWVKYNEPLSATEIYEEKYVRPLPNEGDIYVDSPWKTGKTYVLEHLTISDDYAR